MKFINENIGLLLGYTFIVSVVTGYLMIAGVSFVVIIVYANLVD